MSGLYGFSNVVYPGNIHLNWLIENHQDWLDDCVKEADAWYSMRIGSDEHHREWKYYNDKKYAGIKKWGKDFKQRFGIKQYTNPLRELGKAYGEHHSEKCQENERRLAEFSTVRRIETEQLIESRNAFLNNPEPMNVMMTRRETLREICCDDPC